MTGAAAAREGDGTFLAWATGGAVLAACADLLVAVILGLADGPADPALPAVRDLALPVAGAALLSFAAGAGSWRNPARWLPALAVLHGAMAACGWWGATRYLGGIPRPLLLALGAHAVLGAVALAGAAALRGETEERMGRRTAGAAGIVAENLESVLVAIVFALVIRHFAVEAYKIPTNSMLPTLLGDDAGRGPGDRVLVKKWDAVLGGPERWQIWVFRPPLERAINYVKRVAGEPGEEIRIEDGDLYADGEVCRKPPRTREEMWFPVWPTEGRRDAHVPWSGEGFRRDGEEGFAVSGADGRRLLRFERPIEHGATPVGDVRLRFELESAEPGTVLLARLVGRAGPCEARIPVGGGDAVLEVNGKAVGTFPVAAVPGDAVEVWFGDLQFGATVGGREVGPVPCVPLPPGGRPPFSVSFGVGKGGAAFRGLRLDRDVHYTGSWTFRVPEGHWFFLGDNSQFSEDSRKWDGWEVREIAPGGRTYVSKNRPSIRREGTVEFRDRDGVLRVLDEAAVTVSSRTVDYSFVPRADLHGRAFAIFWPPRWFTRVPGGRIRFLP